jgi:xylose isomerase
MLAQTFLYCAIFGSLDINRGDPQLGWDTDQFPNNCLPAPSRPGALVHQQSIIGFT